MKKMLLLGIMAVALLAAGTAHAAHAGLSLDGETGIARTPMAVTLAPMTLGIAADFVFSEDTFVPIRAEFGIIDGLEVGAKYWYLDTAGDPKIWGLNAKYVLPLTMVENLGVAVGANYDVTSSDAPDDVTDLGIYGVATYTIKAGEMAVVPSAGIKWDTVDNGDSQNGIRFFGSVAVMVMPNLAIAGELISTNDDLDGDDADMKYWVGARFMPIDNLTVQAGYLNYADIGGDDPTDGVFHVGAQYAFSFAQ
jgi:hypothetical protein